MLKGIFSSQSGINGERQDSFNSRLFRSELAGTAPIYALSAGTPKFNLTSKVHYWFEKQPYSSVFSIAGGAAATATTIAIDKPNLIEPQSVVIHSDSGEHMLVTGVSGSNITVIRGFAGTTASILQSGDECLYLGTAKMEGSQAPSMKFRRGVPKFNYSQIFRNAWGDTRSSKHIKFITGNKAAENRMDAIAMHAQDIEMACLLGRKSMSQVNGSEVLSTMDGLTSLVTNNTALTTAVTLDAIMGWLYGLLATNVSGMPNERIAMTSRNVMYILNKLIRENGNSRWDISEDTKIYGLDVTTLQLPGAPQIKLIAHPLFSESATLNKSILAYHPGCLKVGYMTDAEVTDATTPGLDGECNVITSELTMEYADGATGGILSNIHL